MEKPVTQTPLTMSKCWTPAGSVADRAGSLVGKQAIVLTLPAKTTLDSQAAKDGVFSAARVVLGG